MVCDFLYRTTIRKRRSGLCVDTRTVTGHNADMIKSFAHKGLEEFFETGSKKGRMTFYFEGQDAHLVDYMDYH